MSRTPGASGVRTPGGGAGGAPPGAPVFRFPGREKKDNKPPSNNSLVGADGSVKSTSGGTAITTSPERRSSSHDKSLSDSISANLNSTNNVASNTSTINNASVSNATPASDRPSHRGAALNAVSSAVPRATRDTTSSGINAKEAAKKEKEKEVKKKIVFGTIFIIFNPLSSLWLTLNIILFRIKILMN